MNTERDDIYKVDIGTFGDYLKEEWLEPLDMTADSLAKSIGISAAAMSKILSGKNRMSDETGWRLARFFGVSKGYFLRIQAQYTERQQEASFNRRAEKLPIFNWAAYKSHSIS